MIAPITLASGLCVRLVTAPRRSTAPLVVEAVDPGGTTARAELPYPHAGVGGGHFVASPRERFVVLSLYSGQSEEGYALFDLTEGLTLVAGISFERGELASYAFSDDEALLVMALPATCSEWWYLFEDAEPEAHDASRWAVEFGNLFVRDIATGAVSRHLIRVSTPVDWTPPAAKYEARWHPRFLADDRLTLQMPWGEVEFAFPLPTITTLHVQRE